MESRHEGRDTEAMGSPGSRSGWPVGLCLAHATADASCSAGGTRLPECRVISAEQLKAASATGWQEYFPDPSLREVIAQALADNRDLRVAVLNIEAARAVLGQRRADLWPTLNAGASAARGTGSKGNVEGTYTAGLTVSAWELDLFGRIRASSDAAAAQLAASEEGRRAAQVALVASVAQAWLALCADDELLEIARNTVKSREQSLQLTQLRYQHGTASELDLRQAQSLVASAQAVLAQFTRQRELDLNALTLLVGQRLAVTALPRIQSLAFAEVPTGLPSEVLLQRPDVRQAEQLLVAANANIGAARAAYWPRISLTGSLGTASTQLGDLFKDGAWSFAAQLLMPIFDAGRTESLVKGATAQRDIALAQHGQNGGGLTGNRGGFTARRFGDAGEATAGID